MSTNGMMEPARVIVAIDFGTTFSGFSYAHMQSAEGDPINFLDDVEGYEQWPFQAKAGAKAYCKTQTSLLYVQKNSSKPTDYELKGWGWSAHFEHLKLLQKSQDGTTVDDKRFHFITKFKLALAGSNGYGERYILPKGLTPQRVVSDYLHELSLLIEEELRNKFGDQISKKHIQWCLTVPAIWDNNSKQLMKRCAEIAGLVSGPSNVHGEASAHPIIIVLEPEAASVYCLHYLRKTHKTDLPARSKILVVDAGGGTVDLVLHEKVSSGAGSNQVKEICSGSSGALCGATYLDEAFYKLLSRKIPCYEKFIEENPSAVFKIRRCWEDLKVCFDGSAGPYEIWLPAQLSNYWETYNLANKLHGPDSTYDDVKITLDEMKTVFDSAVNTIIELIEKQLAQVKSETVDALMVVGGFSGSPYLMEEIRNTFGARVKRIINPTHAGKAVVTGAVAYGCLGKEIVTSRIARKTYGLYSSRRFRAGSDPPALWFVTDKGENYCGSTIDILVRNGDEVAVNSSLTRTVHNTIRPKGHEKDYIEISVYSCTQREPSYVTDAGVVRECTYNFPIPCEADMADEPRIIVSMYFGRTSIDMTAKGINFQSVTEILPSITFDAAVGRVV